jgi:hypothetical protein
MRIVPLLYSCIPFAFVLAACGDDGGGGNENEVITTVMLSFTPTGGGAAVTAEVDDPDGDGGQAPTVQPVNLTAGAYTLAVRFQNRLEDPAEEITTEVMDESDQHQLFFTGTAVNGPASNVPAAPLTHAYADTDANGLPIGLSNTITAAAGTGNLIVTLRHMPPVNDQPVKTSTTAEMVKTGGFNAIGGSTDAQVTFPVTVQ